MTNDNNSWDERMARLHSGAMRRCACGREHPLPDTEIAIETGALETLPALLCALHVENPFVVMDANTRRAAGDRTLHLLKSADIPHCVFCLPASPKPQADTGEQELLLGNMDGRCDFVLGVGSGVINDLCKMLGKEKGLRTGIVGTAPSMDGYASNSSAMVVHGVKTTVYNQTPALIVCDPDILRAAPEAMLGAGIGDMAAKAISIAEWRISKLVTDEYYCDAIADMMLAACEQVVDGADAIVRRDPQAVRNLTEGLALSGIASSMAQVSRPASGSEHTISHLMDMIAIQRGLPHNLHGVQVGYGVRLALAAYEAALAMGDPIQGAIVCPAQYDQTSWQRDMRRVFGAQAEPLIAEAQREGRNAPDAVQARARKAAAHWAEIREILQDTVNRKSWIAAALDRAGIPKLHAPQQLGLKPLDILDAFIHAKDLRSRYIFPAMIADLGLMPAMRDFLMGVLGVTKDIPRYIDVM